MKRWLSLMLALLIVLSVSAPAMADAAPYSAYVCMDGNGLPKYWLDFTGSIADNPVLHCFFRTDSWYETCYILDLQAALPYSHQNTYRIENVYDEKGRDISNWFKTVSLEIRDEFARLYIERNPATLAGGADSMLLDGLYEMTPAEAGVEYEYIEDRKLKNWLVMNAENAELYFPEGEIWSLQTERAGDYIRNVTRIVAHSGEEVPFGSFTISYVQGAMLLNAKGNSEFSGVFLFNPRVYLQRNNCSAEELGRMAQMYYARHRSYYPPVADVEANGDGTFSIHLYEIRDNGDGTYHTATSAWYTIDASGIGTDDIFENKIDLRM